MHASTVDSAWWTFLLAPIKLNIFNASQGPSREEHCFAINLIEENMKESSSFLLIKDPLQLCLTHFDINEFDCDSYTREVNTLLDSLKSSILPPWTISYELLLDLAKELILSSIQSPPQLELKPLPSTLKYVFLELKDTLPVIIVVCLTPDQENQLIDVLK